MVFGTLYHLYWYLLYPIGKRGRKKKKLTIFRALFLVFIYPILPAHLTKGNQTKSVTASKKHIFSDCLMDHFISCSLALNKSAIAMKSKIKTNRNSLSTLSNTSCIKMKFVSHFFLNL